jgi:uncharacterized protein (TIGR02588 family)
VSEGPSRHDDEDGGHARGRGSPPLERLLGVLGGVLVVGLLAFLAYEGAVTPDTGPDLRARVERIERVGDNFVAHVRVTNDGGETAEGVTVVGEVRAEGRSVHRATTTLSYVPAESGGEATLVFTFDPRRADLTVRAAGYEVP